MTTIKPVRVLLCCLALASRLDAQDHRPTLVSSERLGTVHFQTSCAPAVTLPFDHAVALLHSFEFGPAIRGFNDVLAVDSTCAMAWWGIALSQWTNPMAVGARSLSSLQSGRAAATNATRLVANRTDREKGFVGAVNQLYADYEHTPQRSRIVAYSKAMENVASTTPDTEARIFYAISLVAAAEPSDKTYANQLKAGAMLEALWKAQPDHPGLAHYIIHAYDVPALAPQAKRAAERYSEIAPSAAHALHMPSHTFTRVGMWQESVNTNQRSVAAALPTGNIGEALHASDYMEYAYLQMRNDSAAKMILDSLPSLAAKFNVNSVAGAAPPSAGVFALAAIPARYALERRDWPRAAALVPTTTAFPYAEAMTYLTRALGAAHLGDTVTAKNSVDSLNVIQRRLVTAEPYWAEQVAIQGFEAAAALDVANGRHADAYAKIGEAVKRESATEKSAVTPGPLAPARELLGDMLLADNRSTEALVQYRETLTTEPNRYRSLYGALLSAAAVGDRSAASDYAGQIEKITGKRPIYSIH
jgi:tetratricopeptide (TPR) repeat protein